ncbi:MAG: tetratricopeptide repeat protein [Candidatus Doudnabacteria bacterium]|nr:tetratricopeptide repeat protein [Candidatus Doudnabacteria bacterium]
MLGFLSKNKDQNQPSPLRRAVDMGVKGGGLKSRIKPAPVESPAPPAPPAPEEAGVLQKVDISGFNKAISWSLVGLVFLLPLLVLPLTSELREFNKQSLLFLGVVIMLGIWVIKILTTRSVSWVKTSLDYIVLAFLGLYLVSSLFSIDKASSFLGYYGRFTGSFLSVLALVILYFLIVNNVRTRQLTQKLIKWLAISSGIVVAYGFLQLVGVYLIRAGFAQSNNFNPIGSLVGLSIFTAITLLIVQWLWMNDHSENKLKKLAYAGLTIIGLLVMFLVNAFVAWLVLGLGMIVFLALGMILTDQKQSVRVGPNWFWRPMILLVVSILFVAFQFLPQSLNPRNLVPSSLPIEIQLSNSATMELVGNSLSGGAKQAILGSGPGTTGIAFGNIKPQALNKTVVWSLNFDRASTEVANIAIETGILGLLAFELTAILFLFYGLFFLLRKINHPGRMQAFLMYAIWLCLFITHFFYFFNTTFYFLYWFSLAMFIAITHWPVSLEGEKDRADEVKSLSFSSSPRSALSWMFMSLLLLAVLLVGAFFQAAVYVSDVAYASGLKELNKADPDFADTAAKFQRAITLNPYRDVYYLAYGQNLIFMASKEAAEAEPNIQNVQTWLAGSVNAGVSATRVSPGKASNWSALAQFYAGIRPLGVEGADNAIIVAWSAAIERDPKNPALYIRLARAYSAASEVIDSSIAGSGPDSDQDGLSDAREQELGSNPALGDTNGNSVLDGEEVKRGFNPSGTGRLSAAQIANFTRIDAAMLQKAKEALDRAIELKDDLPDSYIELARIVEKSGDLNGAKAKFDEAAKLFPGNSNIRFEQGRLAFNQGNLAEAQRAFEDVLRAVPNHANAHYSLGLVHQRNGDLAGALAEFEAARSISGPNVELERLINELQGQ